MGELDLLVSLGPKSQVQIYSKYVTQFLRGGISVRGSSMHAFLEPDSNVGWGMQTDIGGLHSSSETEQIKFC